MIRHNFLLVCFIALFAGCDSETSHQLASYPDQQSSGFQLFSKQCSSCHRPPMPDVHVAKAWPMVVARMQQHKEQRGLVRMSDDAQHEVLIYLQTYAKKEVQE